MYRSNFTHAQHTACNTLQHAATHCNTLQHTATHCNTLQHTAIKCTAATLHMSPSRNLGATTSAETQLPCASALFSSLQNACPCACQQSPSGFTSFTRVLHAATRCTTLQHTATHCTTLQHTATHGNTLQRTAAHYNTLAIRQQSPTGFRALLPHCNALQPNAIHTLYTCATHCNTLQNTTTHDNTRQHTATHSNTLQYTATCQQNPSEFTNAHPALVLDCAQSSF